MYHFKFVKLLNSWHALTQWNVNFLTISILFFFVWNSSSNITTAENLNLNKIESKDVIRKKRRITIFKSESIKKTIFYICEHTIQSRKRCITGFHFLFIYLYKSQTQTFFGFSRNVQSFVEKKRTQASLLTLYVPHNPYKFIDDARYLWLYDGM